jgi:hypothetical protein
MQLVKAGVFKPSILALFEGVLEFDLIGAYLRTTKGQGLQANQQAIRFLSEEEVYTRGAAEILLKAALSKPHHRTHIL